MSEAPKRTPKPVKDGPDAKSLPLSPTDGFVLSRVDGVLDEEDLAESTGLPDAQVQASLAKLESMGLIVFGARPAPAQSGAMAAAARLSSVKLRAVSPTAGAATRPTPPREMSAPVRGSQHSQVEAPRSPATASQTQASASPGPAPAAAPAPAVAPAAPPAKPDEAGLLEDIDLDPDLRRRVLDAYRDLDKRDHYALLGVEETADRKVIKRAYFELAAAFHPDRYFRKRLGSFKMRMETVFARLTSAHDTLSNKESRSAYDAYLSEQRISRAIEEHLANGLTQAKQAEAILERQVLAEETLAAPAPPPPVPVTSPQVDIAARRDALARRLLGGSASRPASSPKLGAAATAKSQTPMQPAEAVLALRRRYEERMNRAKAREAQKFATQAEAALASGDSVAAANAFRIAANLNASDVELERKASEARVKADALLADTYMRQAQYEEKQELWPEAARTWARVCKAAPNNPIANERAANAAVKAGGELRDGVRFGQRACELEPKNALFRITLATCYTAAGMALNARRELDTAAQLAPHDDTIQNMIKRVGPTA